MTTGHALPTCHPFINPSLARVAQAACPNICAKPSRIFRLFWSPAELGLRSFVRKRHPNRCHARHVPRASHGNQAGILNGLADRVDL